MKLSTRPAATLATASTGGALSGGARWVCLAATMATAVTTISGADLAAIDAARNRQDRAVLDKTASELAAAAVKQASNAEAQYQAAHAYSYASEVAMELRDKGAAKSAAEAGIKLAERAVAIDGKKAEYHRLLGTLCGQVIPANVLSGLKYGKCAQEEINKAIELDSKSAVAQMGRGVGNYYLPAAFGGGIEIAIKDFQKAIALDPKLAEAHLWLGLALRKANRNADARKAIARSIELNPHRLWAKQQLEKTAAN